MGDLDGEIRDLWRLARDDDYSQSLKSLAANQSSHPLKYDLAHLLLWDRAP